MFLVLSIIGITSITASADEDFMFKSNGDGTCTITDSGNFADVEELTVPITNSTGEAVNEIDSYVLYQCEAKTVIFSDMTAKLNSSIMGYSTCENILIEDCNLEIDSSFASNAEDVKTLTINNSIIEFKDYAFFKLGDEATVSISNSTLIFDSSAFSYGDIVEFMISSSEIEADSSFCSNTEDIVSLNIMDSELELDDYAFFKTGDKADIVIENCSGEVAASAFSYSDVVNLEIKNCQLELGDSFFSNSDRLEKISLGNGEYEFGDYAFFKCEKLKEAIIGDDSQENEFIFGDSTGSYSKKLLSLKIGDGHFELGSSFFSNCDDLTSVTISDSAEMDFNEYAFYGGADDLQIQYCGNNYNYEGLRELF